MNNLPSLKWSWMALALFVVATAFHSVRSKSSTFSKTDARTAQPTLAGDFLLTDASVAPVPLSEPTAASPVPAHDVQLDIHSALAAFSSVLAETKHDLSQADLVHVDRLVTNLRIQAESESMRD